MKVSAIQAAIVVLVGLTVGVGCFTFIYAKGYSYLSNDPQACANCHVMNEQLSGWMKGSHRSVAVCNDCHTPHDFFGKYSTKAENGLMHSFAFTSGWFPDSIEIKQHSRNITEANCRRCHEETVMAMDGPHQTQKASCLRCHASVGHM